VGVDVAIFFFFQAEDGIRDFHVTGVQTCALPIFGTPATRLKEQVPEDVKRERIYHLIEVQNRISRKKNEEWVGRTVEVLVEGVSHKDPSKLSGRSRQNKLVVFSGGQELIGKTVDVRVVEAQTWSLSGELVG